MRKIKVTQKYINQNFKNIISINYCKLQFLLNDKEPLYYNNRYEGWAFDVYVIDNNTCICTGYSPIGNIKPLTNMIQLYNRLGGLLLERYSYPTKNYEITLDYLIKRFVREVLRKEGK